MKAVWSNEKIEYHLLELLIQNCYEILDLKYDNFEITKDESPDYIINSGCQNIGVEITRAMNQNLQKASSIVYENFHNDFSFSPTIFENKQMSKKEILNSLNRSANTLVGKAYKGYKLEENVLDNITNAIMKKIKKFKNYKQFDKNILLIHSENRASLDIDILIEKLTVFLVETNTLFDYIFLKISDKIFYFSDNQNGYCIINIKNDRQIKISS